jgi:hypothetical protein
MPTWPSDSPKILSANNSIPHLIAADEDVGGDSSAACHLLWPWLAAGDGLEARKAGDEDTATGRLGQAVALAHESGNEDTAKLLAKVVDVIDPATGTIRLKAKVADADEMALDTRSTKTVRART